MQSPARARYSPFASVAASGVFCCAIAVVANSVAANATIDPFRVRGIFTLPSSRLAAAFKRHGQAPARRKGRILRRRTRGKIGGDRLDVVFAQEPRYELHAVGHGGRARAVAPAAKLPADVGGTQAEQAGDRG